MDLFYKTKHSLVADMSSDFLSRKTDFNRFDIIYAGAQKNAGAAGVTIVVINKNVLGKVDRKIPSILDYRNHIEAGSLLNTPPVFAIYVSMLTLRWLKNKGGLAVIEKENDHKAKLFYDTLDSISIFKGNVAREDRSKMNACFTIPDATIEKEFVTICKNEGMEGIKGHRSAGGYRVSMYNALPLSSIKALTDLMIEFGRKKG
jgi:phosphoserine aminotransferase